MGDNYFIPSYSCSSALDHTATMMVVADEHQAEDGGSNSVVTGLLYHSEYRLLWSLDSPVGNRRFRSLNPHLPTRLEQVLSLTHCSRDIQYGFAL